MRNITKVILMAMCAIFVAGAAFAGTQDFTLVNKTGVTINALYSNPSSASKRGEDILGVDVLADGESVTINFSGYEDCQWDLRIEDSDGNALEWDGLNLCNISKVTLHWDGTNATADLE